MSSLEEMKAASDAYHEAMLELRLQMNRTLDGMVESRSKLVMAMDGFGKVLDTIHRRAAGNLDPVREVLSAPEANGGSHEAD